jgi:hypothetical protein
MIRGGGFTSRCLRRDVLMKTRRFTGSRAFQLLCVPVSVMYNILNLTITVNYEMKKNTNLKAASKKTP